MNSKTFGSILIVAGTSIGAGMLATPIITSASGFVYASITLIVLWIVMCISALLTAEATLAFPAEYNGFNTMARATLGRTGLVISCISFLGLLYALNAAYISGGGSILSSTLMTFFNFDLPEWASCIIFLVVFGSVIYSGARSVDMVNRFLISIKGFIFILTIALVTPYIDLNNLFFHAPPLYLIAAFPILITAFGFHVVVPTIATYTNSNVRSIVMAIILGSFIPLVIYLIWLAGILGVIPLEGEMSFVQIIHDSVATEKDEVGVLLSSLSKIVQNNWVAASLNIFSHLAITTSFLGVGLSLFDYLLDTRKDRTQNTRLQMIALTFLPPLIFALYYPQGFRQALSISGIFVALTCLILPALFAWQVRTSKTLNSPLRIPGGILTILFVLFFGFGVIVLEILNQFALLPTLHSEINLEQLP